MKRQISLILILLLLLGLCGCSIAGGSPLPETEAPVTPAPMESTAPALPSPEVDDSWREAYLSFLSENYEALADAFVVGIAGTGFIDLDLDGTPEMLIFDSGASAAMGVQIFDIIGSNVTCVSANLLTVSEAFGDAYTSDVYVNTNFMDAFRLKQRPDGSRFFCIESGNGAVDFSYTELISFGIKDGSLAPESLLYCHEEYEEESGDIIAITCTKNGEAIDLAAYEYYHSQFFKENADCGYTAAGAFVWENKAFDNSYDGFLAMAEAALALYVPVAE